MPVRVAVRTFGVVVLLFGLAAPAAAQASEQMAAETNWGSDLQRGFLWGAIYGGFTAESGKQTLKKMRAELNFRGLWNPVRPNPSLGRRPRQAAGAEPAPALTLRLVGAADITRFDFGDGNGGFTAATFLGGVRAMARPRERFLPYVQGAAGFQRAFEETAFVIEPSGGVIMPVGRYFVNVGAGLGIAFFEGGSDTAFHLLGGLTFPLGSR